jgi:hypothetical protein
VFFMVHAASSRIVPNGGTRTGLLETSRRRALPRTGGHGWHRVRQRS